MTNITREEVDKLADLSRIELSDAEKEEIKADLESILQYVSEIQEVAADEPPVEERIGMLKNVMREDGEAHPERTYTKDMVKSAPRSEGDYIKVKKILG